MRTITLIYVIALFLFNAGCGKGPSSAPPIPPGGTADCRPVSESTTLVGNAATYDYSYSADGNLSSIVRYIGGGYHVMADSTMIYYDHTVRYSPGNRTGTYNIVATAFDANIFTGSPSKADISITLDGIEQRNYYSYLYFYDTKGRLVKIGEQTNTVPNDLEYDLNIVYNDQDNVTALQYETTTGPRTTNTISVTGYDDKPNPFRSIKNWPLMMHAGWANNDPEPVFTALSKNNPLGYTIPGWKREISYEYNDNGFPLRRINTNTTVSGSYSFEESFIYQCK